MQLHHLDPLTSQYAYNAGYGFEVNSPGKIDIISMRIGTALLQERFLIERFDTQIGVRKTYKNRQKTPEGAEPVELVTSETELLDSGEHIKLLEIILRTRKDTRGRINRTIFPDPDGYKKARKIVQAVLENFFATSIDLDKFKDSANPENIRISIYAKTDPLSEPPEVPVDRQRVLN